MTLKSFPKKISSLQKNSSLRRQIMITIFISFLISFLIILFISQIALQIMKYGGSTYQTNADIDNFLEELYGMEDGLESYMRYRTFESIDKYYHYEALAENRVEGFKKNPNVIETNQIEYIIRQLSLSFFDFSNKAVAARRSNNSIDSDIYLAKSRECYKILREKVTALNMLFFKLNAQNYNLNKIRSEKLIHRSIVVVLLILLSLALLMYSIISHITHPLHDISSVALRIAERDFDVPLFNTDRTDEIGNICHAFDAMIISIREYIDTIWEKALKENELREKEIEVRALYTEAHLEALQDQIKPHFLFNTLNTGAQLAMIEGADKTCFFLEQVADFLRYTVEHTGLDATIGEELGMLDNYIYIMKVRFGERYQFIKNIDESVLATKMPNMILQPLVENCITHGLKDVTENGCITICVQGKTDAIEISISDNGVGFDEEKRLKILKEAEKGVQDFSFEISGQDKNKEPHVSVGLVNVISRLKFYFKDNDIFSILQNPQGKGTMFYIKIKNV